MINKFINIQIKNKAHLSNVSIARLVMIIIYLFAILITIWISNNSWARGINRLNNQDSDSSLNSNANHGSNYIYIIRGNVSTEVEENIRLKLNGILASNIDNSIRFRFAVEQLVGEGLRGMGYFNYKITIVNSDDKEMVLDIDQGVRAKYLNNQVEIIGDGANSSYFKDIINNLPKNGDPLDYQKYDHFITEVNNTAQTYGYFNLHYLQRQIEVNTDTNRARWKITINTGKRFRFGDIDNNSQNINPQLVNNVISFKSGELFNQYKVTTSSYYLNNFNWFSTVSLDPKFDYQNDTVDYFADVVRGKRNRVDVIVGYDTLQGVVFKSNYSRFFISNRGDSFDAGLELAKKGGKASLEYRLPVFSDPANANYNLQVTHQYIDTSFSKSYNILDEVILSYNYSPIFKPNFNISLLHDNLSHFTAPGIRERDEYNYVKFGLSYTYSDRLNYPTIIFKPQIEYVNNFGLNNTKFSKVEASVYLSWAVNNNNRIDLRTTSGRFIKIDKQLPNNLMFFSGGYGSVRGYSTDSIGEMVNGNLIGGRKKYEGSIEYLRRLGNSKLWLGGFVDVGFSGNQYRNDKLKYGVGSGIRYELNFGNIILDFAWPVQIVNHSLKSRLMPSFYLSFSTGI